MTERQRERRRKTDRQGERKRKTERQREKNEDRETERDDKGKDCIAADREREYGKEEMYMRNLKVENIPV